MKKLFIEINRLPPTLLNVSCAQISSNNSTLILIDKKFIYQVINYLREAKKNHNDPTLFPLQLESHNNN